MNANSQSYSSVGCRRRFAVRYAVRQRSGIILLVVLGMLTLFSVLGVSYLVFTSRQRAASIAIQRATKNEVNAKPWLDEALAKIMVGSAGPESSLWSHDLLADLYGMRDAIEGQMTTVAAGNVTEPQVLLGSFVRIPTELYQSARYPNRRDSHALMPERAYPRTVNPTFKTDDELAGRILTFFDGPLAGTSMRILRYFGDHGDPTDAAAPDSASNGRNVLSGQLVLDLRPHLTRSITVASRSQTMTIADWIDADADGADPFNISEFFYDRLGANPDQPLSNFYINGRILNGPGLGWDVDRSTGLVAGGPKYNLNATISTDLIPTASNPSTNDVKAGADFTAGNSDVPEALQGHYALYRRSPQPSPATQAIEYLEDLPPGDSDESYDAPDEQNMWLSYFPTDATLGFTDVTLGFGAPSFVRPGLVNWLINQDGASLDAESPARLRQILRAIQRSTLRPLAIENDPQGMPVSVASRGPGVLKLDYSKFTGSNPTALGMAIDFSEADSTVLAGQIRQLARALAGIDTNGDKDRDWDVDNNGDGTADSVWVDAGLALTQDENGKLIKPLVSYLVEDLSGRVNVNLAGNLAQAQNKIPRAANGYLFRSGGGAGTVNPTGLATGFGYGPAEIDLRPIFVRSSSPPMGASSGIFDLLRRRLNTETVSGNTYIAAGKAVDPLTASGNDFLGGLRQPQPENLHNLGASQGLPVDRFGRTTVTLGIGGGLMVSTGSVPVDGAGALAGDAENDPYEMDPTPGEQPDNPFGLSDLEAMLRFDDFDRDALESELVALAGEHYGVGPNARINKKGFANSITTISNSAAENVGTLPTALRDNPDAAEAFTPQTLLTRYFPGESFAAAEERNAVLMQILPQSVLAGGKLDLNRPFGNGEDDDGDGIVDDPEELRGAVETYYRRFFRTADTDVTSLTPGKDTGDPEPTPETSPQSLFARHLYVVALALSRDPLTSPLLHVDLTYGAGITIDPTNQTVKRDGTPNSSAEEYRAWRIAQWAINVADFRDPDGIMSRFDYDVSPFDGWDITSVSGESTYRTVWGMEYPELSLEESLAFHDRRVRDTNLDPSGDKRFVAMTFRDADPDQWRLPQGSLFLEIRNTRSPDFMRVANSDTSTIAQTWGAPTDLYSLVNLGVDLDSDGDNDRELMLNLAKLAPDGNPVWRVAISKAHPSGTTERQFSADEVIQPLGGSTSYVPGNQDRLTATLQPENPTFFGPRTPPPGSFTPTLPKAQFWDAIERVIWFSDQDPDPDGDGIVNFAPEGVDRLEQVFYSRHGAGDYPYQIPATPGTELFLRGGQYAVIGPRTFTNVGSLETDGTPAPVHDATTGEPLVNYVDYESRQQFELRPDNFVHQSVYGTRTTPTVADGAAGATIREMVGVVAAADSPTGWSGPNLIGDPVTGSLQAIGLSVSEPLPNMTGPPPAIAGQYYPTPTSRLKGSFPLDSWYDFAATTGNLPNTPFDQVNNELLSAPEQLRTGTRERFKTAYLQRLADPTEPYDAHLNPYRTVDYISIDLTVFNGSDVENFQPDPIGNPTEWVDNADDGPYSTAPDEAFATRYKTGRTVDTAATVGSVTENLSHSANTFPPKVFPGPPPTFTIQEPYIKLPLSLDALVDPDNGGVVDDMPTSPHVHSSTLGYANASYGERWRTAVASTAPSPYAGMPTNPSFSTLGWLNRPFVSKGELMLVPTTSAAGLITSFGTATVDTGLPAGANVYTDENPPARRRHNLVFPHLWNFHSTDPDITVSLNLYQILDWVDVPAPFDFEHDFLSPNSDPKLYAEATTGPAASRWGDRINFLDDLGGGGVVTSDPDTWTNPPSASFWLQRYPVEAFRAPFNFLQPQYRHGRINLNTIKTVEVFQALMSGAPVSSEVKGAFFEAFTDSRRGYGLALPSGESLGFFFDKDHPSQMTGAFRHSSGSGISPLNGTEHRLDNPLGRTTMRPEGLPGSFGPQPLFSLPTGASTATSEFAERSPLHRFLSSTRLSNLATDQSNTFAVWVTVGLFEVDSDTLSVGAEVGSDSGNTKRFREFHIIDRSIPVMYQPGKLNNAREAVLMSRSLN